MTAVLSHTLFSFEFMNPMTLRNTRILSSCNSQYMWDIQVYTAVHLDVLSPYAFYSHVFVRIYCAKTCIALENYIYY